MRALGSALHGWQDTAPLRAVHWFERAQFVTHHAGWTYRDYDEASAGDILLDRDYQAIVAGLKDKDEG